MTPIIMKRLTSTIIGPHGITDMIHANQTKVLPELCTINALTVGSSVFLLNANMNIVLDTLFFVASIVHFRRDMPEIKIIPRYVWSTSLVLSFILTQRPEVFFMYMLFFHVPHHYLMSWKFMKNNVKDSIKLVGFTTFILGISDVVIGNILYMEPFISIIKGIIISHVVYEELYIHNHKSISEEVI